ncbi:uncharacterized protein LOC132558499 [Ylistrum balloti]|uniref:uncharacterized protein LOC132558499 n=1 Tax=Ylistrum balloti TaxID=509963 RepID=UPI002905D6BF|nr:uncharacterized protein LOC132558499 [Ylistrum balloti]
MAGLTQAEQCIEAIQNAADRVCFETNKLRDSMIARVRRQLESKDDSGSSTNESEERKQDVTLYFQPGDVCIQKVQDILGRLEAESDTVKHEQLWRVSSFHTTTRSVDILESTTTEYAWSCNHHQNLCLVDKYGKVLVKREINHVPESIATDDSGAMYYTSYREMAVKKLDVSGKVGYVFNTSPLHPMGLCLSNEGNLLICVVDKFDFVTGKDKPKDILKVKLDNGVATSVKFKDENERLTAPYRILENINGDVVVIDGLSSKSGRVVAFNDVGGLKFIYSCESPGNDESFCPTNMCIDFKGNIFVIDGGSHSIHVLNSSGKLQRKFASYEIGGGEPTVVSIGRDGLMWVGHADGEVTVFRHGRSSRPVSREVNEKETFF